MNSKLNKIDELWEEASHLAIKVIVEEARKILKADPDLNEFIMAMGSCFFTYNEKSKYDIFSYTDEQFDEMSDNGHDWYGADNGILHERFQPKFMEMVDNMNKKFKVLGYPVRFTAKGEEIHDW